MCTPSISSQNIPSDDKSRSSSQGSERCGETSLTTTLDGNQPFTVLGPPMQASSKASSNPADKIDNEVLMVDRDGPDDPQNPRNWSFKCKWAATAIVSGLTFITPVSSSMIAPATDQLAAEFGIHSSVVIALSTSMFVLAFGTSNFPWLFVTPDHELVAVGPLFLGPMSETYGRSRVLQLANLWYLVPRSRPAVVLLAIAECSTWRWVSWSIIQLLGLFFLKETYAPLLLERNANKSRQSMDEEKVSYKEVRTIFEGDDCSWQVIMSRALLRPFALVYHEPIIQLLCLYMADISRPILVFLTTISSMFEQVYQLEQPVGVAGLH
ncbi:hypothetical protein PAXINDRAFT_17571 [Paxillus involutus ATCC 200175]|uniref:Uncharacterized protein n=1 Tax=Paxillus involutus ATCC 200175 TaxID=664439 RepID=A0A0C9TNC6_PAXIN|nr:hypothetical protein PAXINDRAFT_17571 [Paxillus involutus ATCC 200175]